MLYHYLANWAHHILETPNCWKLQVFEATIFRDGWLTVEIILVQTYAGCETWEACAMTKFKELSLSSSSVSSSSTACCCGFSFRTSYKGKKLSYFKYLYSFQQLSTEDCKKCYPLEFKWNISTNLSFTERETGTSMLC